MRQWMKFQSPPGSDWRRMTDQERASVVTIFRAVSGPEMDDLFDDEQLLDAFFDLIRAGLIDIYIRFRKGGVETQLIFPKGKSAATARAVLHGYAGALH